VTPDVRAPSRFVAVGIFPAWIYSVGALIAPSDIACSALAKSSAALR